MMLLVLVNQFKGFHLNWEKNNFQFFGGFGEEGTLFTPLNEIQSLFTRRYSFAEKITFVSKEQSPYLCGSLITFKRIFLDIPVY